MGNRVSQYTIDLEIENGDRVRQTVDGIERTLRGISDAAKSGDLSAGLSNAAKSAQDLESQMQAIAATGDGASEAFEAYSRTAGRAIADLEKQATKINFALSEAGKKQRERIAALEQEKAALGDTREEQARKKEIQAELKKLQKDVLQGTDEELRAALANNRAIRARLKLAQENAKVVKAAEKEQKTFAGLVKDDFKALKEKIKLQFKFIEALKTTEGRYAAIKKAAGAVGRGAATLAKGVGVGVAGSALALGGAAIASAGAQVDRERQVARIRAPGLSGEDKDKLLGDLYIRTGADYSSIVDAINRVTSVLGAGASKDELAQATAAEIKFPGAAAMFRQQTTAQATAKDFSVYANRVKALQGATGASVEQISSSTEKIANMRQRSFSNASMTDLQSVYLALQNSGAFDTQEELDRAFNAFVRNQAQSGKDVFDFARGFDWQKYAYGQTNKQQMAAAISNLDWGSVETAARTTESKTGLSAAEKTAMKMRELEEKKNKILAKLLEAIAPILDAIDVDELGELFESFLKLAKVITPLIPPLVHFVTEIVGNIVSAISALVEWIQNFIEWVKKLPFVGGDKGEIVPGSTSALDIVSRGASGMSRANGGIVQMPSLCGEAGPEAVIPLDYSRSARANNIMQNVSQTFNLRGNETTAMSIASAVKSRDFMRAIGDSEYIGRRFGR